MPKIPVLPNRIVAGSRIVAGGMLREGTPVEDYRLRYGLWVKREDLACPPPGPPFSKTRGVYEHVRKRPERIIGVLDTVHSQAGHAVARACQVLGKKCINFYPVYKHKFGLREPQVASQSLGAELVGLPAGRSCILYHAAKKQCIGMGGYMMPNALKLSESIEETAKECMNVPTPKTVLIPVSSGTIAAGVIRGFGSSPLYIAHLGYSRSHDSVRTYLRQKSGVLEAHILVVDEGYEYKDVARIGETPPWPCNEWYDLKAVRWWLSSPEGRQLYEQALLWNIG